MLLETNKARGLHPPLPYRVLPLQSPLPWNFRPAPPSGSLTLRKCFGSFGTYSAVAILTNFSLLCP